MAEFDGNLLKAFFQTEWKNLSFEGLYESIISLNSCFTIASHRDTICRLLDERDDGSFHFPSLSLRPYKTQTFGLACHWLSVLLPKRMAAKNILLLLCEPL